MTWTHWTQETSGHSKMYKGCDQHRQPPSIIQMQGMRHCKNDQISKEKNWDASDNPRGTIPHGLWLCARTKTPSIAPAQATETKTWNQEREKPSSNQNKPWWTLKLPTDHRRGIKTCLDIPCKDKRTTTHNIEHILIAKWTQEGSTRVHQNRPRGRVGMISSVQDINGKTQLYSQTNRDRQFQPKWEGRTTSQNVCQHDAMHATQ